MASPGEVTQAIGRAYALALVGCLEGTVNGFRGIFDAETSPEKLSFALPSGRAVSFDASGVLERKGWPPREVLIECKGHRDGNAVLDGYRTFLGNAFFVSNTIARHSQDAFWFATNVPFGSTYGRRLTEYDVVNKLLQEHEEARSLIASAKDPVDLVHRFLGKVTVCIFPDSFMRLTGVSYRVRQDDNLWTILAKLHGGVVPVDDYQPIANSVARQNDLASPDLIEPGASLQVPWFGIAWPEEPSA